jgi:acetyltransferase-like isoleucine patch superfamily enzyme
VTFLRRPIRNAEIGEFTYADWKTLRLRTWLPNEKIIIGKYCSIADGVTIFTGGQHRTDLASTYPIDILLVRMKDRDKGYQTTANTVVGNDVWIGSGVTILGGVSVGDGAVLASRAVVFADVPPYAIVAGNPAQVVRFRFSRKAVERLLKIAWWHWPADKVKANVEWFYRPIAEFIAQFDPVEGGPAADR